MEDYTSAELFKTVKRGGYDRDDVEKRFREVKDAAAEEKNKLLLVLRSKEKKIAELNEEIEEKDREIRRLDEEIKQLRKDIDEKYKSYIENYDTIGQLVYDAKLRANEMISAAETESARLIRNAEEESERIRSSAKESADRQLGLAQDEMDEKIKDGRRSYASIQDEISELVSYVNQIQREFMRSVKTIHELSDSVLNVEIDDSDLDELQYDEEEPSPEDESRLVEEAMSMPDEDEA